MCCSFESAGHCETYFVTGMLTVEQVEADAGFSFARGEAFK